MRKYLFAVFYFFSAPLLLLPGTANAASFSFTGTFDTDDEVQIFDLAVEAESSVTLRTYSYAGGTQANGNIVQRGGFDPVLALFDGMGKLLDHNDDDDTGVVATDPETGWAWDTLLNVDLVPGSYRVAVMQYDNFPNGPTLSQGFQRQGQGNFTPNENINCAATSFCDRADASPANQRSNRWAFDVLNVDQAKTVPVPAAAWFLGFGIIGLLRFAKRN